MTITPELREAIESAGDEPLRLEDPKTSQTYVMLRAEVYDRLRALLEDDGPSMREVGALVERAMAEVDAGDPLLDSYQRYRP